MSTEFNLPYIKVEIKYLISHFIAAIFIIAGIAYVPGYINAFILVSLLLDKQPKFKVKYPKAPITIVIACHNEESRIRETLSYVAKQDYAGNIKIIVVDNCSSDKTADMARQAGEDYHLDLDVIFEGNPGKFNALNKALNYVKTEYLITLDADTLLHREALRYLVSRMNSAPKEVCAVAGAVLVRNSRTNFVTKLQEWDYFIGISSIKRMQGLYQGTLVAQGAYSLYKTDELRAIGGWPNAIGEDIVITWDFLRKNLRVYFEPMSIAFTDVPENLKHLARQRSRWARGMIEALNMVKPWQHPIRYVRYLTGINLVMPYLDIVYTFCWMPGLVLALLGKFWIVGPMTLLVIPLAIMQNMVLLKYQKEIFQRLGLKIRENYLGYIAYILFYQMIMSPISVIGYIQELMGLDRVWK
ncbi:glycosyltransferase [Proteiniborus sp. MB09-C3]|uniref:glycosyltransferase family 2 protein n=1 Tax=Proteiniborus sp. MB09-C3 TaxID=3050072 RepID=UPI0025574D1F|nr:glycosyltransferase [Proteiniborus sp. MB09-C3]WIV12388.1 glycosyltransferase [Proteiniborus sp. MB09-C3]